MEREAKMKVKVKTVIAIAYGLLSITVSKKVMQVQPTINFLKILLYIGKIEKYLKEM